MVYGPRSKVNSGEKKRKNKKRRSKKNRFNPSKSSKRNIYIKNYRPKEQTGNNSDSSPKKNNNEYDWHHVCPVGRIDIQLRKERKIHEAWNKLFPHILICDLKQACALLERWGKKKNFLNKLNRTPRAAYRKLFGNASPQETIKIIEKNPGINKGENKKSWSILFVHVSNCMPVDAIYILKNFWTKSDGSLIDDLHDGLRAAYIVLFGDVPTSEAIKIIENEWELKEYEIKPRLYYYRPPVDPNWYIRELQEYKNQRKAVI